MSRPLFVKVNNAWKEGTSYIKVGGSWKQVTELGVKIAGSWKSSGEPHTTHVFDRQVVSSQYEIFPPRCIEDGLYYYSCSCGLSSAGITGATFYVPATGGDYNYFPLQYITSDLTHAKKCQQCGGPHELEHHVVSNWTQTALDGTIVQLTGTCSVCGATAKHTHDTSSTQNCEYCDLTVECQHLITETIPGSEASCTSTGLTEGVKCASCGKVLQGQTIIAAKGHDFSSTWLYNVSRQRVSPATCTSDAVYTRECTRCVAQSTSTFTASQASGGSGLEYKLGHDWADADCDTPKTCKREGCGATEGTALGHDFSVASDELSIEASCQEPASYLCKCSRCGTVSGLHTTFVGDVDPNNHSRLEYRAKIEATCNTNGREAGTYCTACNTWASGGGVIKAGHKYNSGTTTSATCTTEGYTTKTCTVCGHSYTTNTVPATGHTYTRYAGLHCNNNGTHSKIAQCANCTATTIKSGSSACTASTPATCTTPGICECGYTVKAALGHTWVNGVCTTCSTTCNHVYFGNGCKKTCRTCGKTYTQHVDVNRDGICDKCGAAIFIDKE